MNTISEQKLVRGIALVIIFVAILVHQLGLAPNSADIHFLAHLKSGNFYVTAGFFTIAILIPYFAVRRNIKEKMLVMALGIISAAAGWLVYPDSWKLEFWSIPNVLISIVGLGIFSIFAVLLDKDVNNKQINQQLISLYLFVFALQFGIFALIDLTFTLHPRAFDAVAFHIDATLGFYPSAQVAHFAAVHPIVKSTLDVVYKWVPAGMPVLFALQLRQKRKPPANMLVVWAVASIASVIAYHFCPISGPIRLFGGDFFPNTMPAINLVADTQTIVEAVYRNGMPSMHFGLGLMLIFTARYQQSRTLNFTFIALAALTFLSTLANGEHYLIDLIVSFPFIVAIQSYCTHVTPSGQKSRLQAIWTGILLWLLWVALVRYGLFLFEHIPGFTPVMMAMTIGISLLAYRRLSAHTLWDYQVLESKAAAASEFSPGKFGIPEMFFISGFTGLMYLLIFSKQMALIFGSMATANLTVFAVYLGGLAIGSVLGGWLVARTRYSGLVLYAAGESVIGIYCLLTPLIFSLMGHFYIIIANGISPDATKLTLIRLICGSVVLIVPTVLMGIRLPVMVADMQNNAPGIGGAFAKLVGANLSGAACGALLAGYFIFPCLGMYKSVTLAALGSLTVAFIAIKLNKQSAAISVVREIKVQQTDVPLMVARTSLAVLFIGGCVMALLGINYVQLLTVVTGNSIYAFPMMLFSLLLGLGIGARMVQNPLSENRVSATTLALLAFGSGAIILVDVFQWSSLPTTFSAYSTYAVVLDFSARESVRAIVCWFMLFPPAALIGAGIPIALELATAMPDQRNKIALLGRGIGLNALGNVAGIVLGGFIVTPMLSLLQSIWLSVALCVVMGLLMAMANRQMKNPLIYGALSSLMVLAVLQPDSFNYRMLSSGSNIYFQYRDYGNIINHAESVDSGLTTVTVQRDKEDREIRSLLTNGNLQGRNAFDDEMKAQLGIAAIPLLHTENRDSALLIGYGTGVSALAIREAGFRQLDIVELNHDLITMADAYFAEVNRRVSTQPGVHVFKTDGRNFLLMNSQKYDLISVNITPVWTVGAGLTYNEEFYRLASDRISEHGVMQQQIPLSHLTPIDLASILGSVRSAFPSVALYIVGEQATVVATKNLQGPPSISATDAIRTKPELMRMLEQLHLNPEALINNLVLTPDQVNQLLQIFSTRYADFDVSTDDNLFLEFSTPKSNALNGTSSTIQMEQFLKRFSAKNN